MPECRAGGLTRRILLTPDGTLDIKLHFCNAQHKYRIAEGEW